MRQRQEVDIGVEVHRERRIKCNIERDGYITPALYPLKRQ
jgi:hypothetical protein